MSIAALAPAGSAAASFAPKLVASTDVGSTTVRLGFVLGADDDPAAKAEIYVPAGYQVATPAPGTKLGGLQATGVASDLGSSLLPLSGEVDAIPLDASAAAQCGAETATQAWDLHMTAVAETWDVPVYVAPTSGAETSAGPAKLVLCFQPPDVASPSRALSGLKLLSATFDVSAITEPAGAGDYRWTSRWTPFTPGLGVPNSAGSVESQSVRRVPTRLKLTVTKERVKLRRRIRTRFVFLSTVTENGRVPAGVTVTTTVAGKRVGGTTGSFELPAGKRATITAVATIDRQAAVPSGQAANQLYYADLGSSLCVRTPFLGVIPCLGATSAATTITAKTTVTAFKK